MTTDRTLELLHMDLFGPTMSQNGVVERKNRTLLDMARTMLDEYKTSNRF